MPASTLSPSAARLLPQAVKPEYQFLPAPGDIVTFTRHIGRLPWPTPFTFNVLGGSVPKWKRYAYDRLLWTKNSGSKVEITWRTEYWHYRRTGWADQIMNRLTTVRIIPSGIEKSAAAYLKKTKGWSASEYRLEFGALTSEDVVVNVIYLKDESAATQPGAGESVVLLMNRSSAKMIGETGWQ